MKKVFLSLAMLSVTFAFSQKKEINAAFKAIEAGDVATTTSQVAAADAAIGSNISGVAPDLLEKYYYAKGLSLMKSGKTAEGAAYLAKINDLKSAKFTPTLSAKVGPAINPILQASNKEAMDAYNSKDYAKAGTKFTEVYNLLKAAGQDNKQYLYYSAVTLAQAGKQKEAIDIYNQLIDSGYTGVETKYLAKNKKTGQVEEMDKTNFELMKKLGASADYTDFKTETSKSVEQELYETDAALLAENGQADQALALIEKGLKKFPTSSRLSELQATTYYKAGKMDQFTAALKDKVAKNPTDFESYYNLGVLTSKDPAKTSEAVGYFNKALEIKPTYAPALQNLTYLTMGDDEKAVADIEAARKAGKTDLFNKLLTQRRDRFAKALPYAEKWYAADPNNSDVVSLLKGFYSSTKNDVKYNEFKAKEAALKAQQK